MALIDTLELRNFDRDELDFDSIGNWPLGLRLLLLGAVVAVVLVLGYLLQIRDQYAELDAAVATEQQLRTTYEQKAFTVANLATYRAQLAELEQRFEGLLAQLPTDTEMPGLLEDITGIGAGSSLNIKTIALEPEQEAEFYIELPIRIVATGGYHDIGSFVSGVTALPRIVTFGDFAMKADAGGILFEIAAKTYRYRGLGD